MVVMLAATLVGCSTGRYTPLSEAEKNEVEQLKENVYRVEYRTSAFASQNQLDRYLRRRCADLAIREGYDFFHVAGRSDVLGFSRRTAMTVTLYKGHKPIGIPDLYDAQHVLAETGRRTLGSSLVSCIHRSPYPDSGIFSSYDDTVKYY